MIPDEVNDTAMSYMQDIVDQMHKDMLMLSGADHITPQTNPPLTATGVRLMQQNIQAQLFYQHSPYKIPVAYDPHPWTSNLHSLAEMLESNERLPHLIDGFTDGKECYFSNCDVCLEALKLRARYRQEKSNE